MHLPIRIEHFNHIDSNNRINYRLVFKRILDIFFSLIILLITLPLVFPLITLSILLDGGGVLFFVQERKGYKGKIFNCYKLKTMQHIVLPDGTVETRINKYSKILRNTGLDELPQLLNVIKGDMSLVGPRPYSLEDDLAFQAIVPYYHMRTTVPPGITGLAQTYGYKGWITSNDEILERTAIDVIYTQQYSSWKDIKIIFRSSVLLIVEIYKSIWKR
jgi:putative colanic acid biosynthesis UDP-glucose lipid carrier transferase